MPIARTSSRASSRGLPLCHRSCTFILSAKLNCESVEHDVFASDKTVFNATPAVNRGQLLLRSDQALYALHQKEQRPPGRLARND